MEASRLSPAEQWSVIIPYMGMTALLRNLRNFDRAGISDSDVALVCRRLTDPVQVQRSRIFPYQVLTAYLNLGSVRWADALEQMLGYTVQAIPELPGTSDVLIDTSDSMNNLLSSGSGSGSRQSRRSGDQQIVRPTRLQAAALYGICTALRNPGRVRVYGFATDSFRAEGITAGNSVLRMTEAFCRSCGRVGHGTRIAAAMKASYSGEDRMLIFTDEQAFDETVHTWYGMHGDVTHAVPGDVPVYAWNLAGYESGAMAAGGGNSSSRRYELGGLTDAAFAMIPRIEAGLSAAWPWERKENENAGALETEEDRAGKLHGTASQAGAVVSGSGSGSGTERNQMAHATATGWTVERIARIVWEANRQLQIADCDAYPDEPWDVAPRWRKELTQACVRGIVTRELSCPRASHEEWRLRMIRAGWSQGEEKNPELRQHPGLRNWYELTPRQQLGQILLSDITMRIARTGEEIDLLLD